MSKVQRRGQTRDVFWKAHPPNLPYNVILTCFSTSMDCYPNVSQLIDG